MIIKVKNIEIPELEIYGNLSDRAMRKAGNTGEGLFIAESPKVIDIALWHGYEPVSLLCEEKHIEGDAACIVKRLEGIPIYTGEREVLASLTGYELTRGVLCAMKRPLPPDPAEILQNAKRICIMQEISDSTNVGAIFRSASALGMDAVLVSRDSCDPFNRRVVRVSMGTIFTIPWTFSEHPVTIAKELGFRTLAMALSKDSMPINKLKFNPDERLAIVLGSEGWGLPEKIIRECDQSVIIPMHHKVDSLNVGAAAAIAFWEISNKSNKMD